MRRLLVLAVLVPASCWLLWSACESDDYRDTLPFRSFDASAHEGGAPTTRPDLSQPDLGKPDQGMPDQAKPDQGQAGDGGGASDGGMTSDGGVSDAAPGVG